MRIFNKMKKAMLVVAASLFAVGSTFADTAILSHTTMGAEGVAGTKANLIIGASGTSAEGFSVKCANESKTLDPADALTIDGTSYRTIKASNGAQSIVTLPEGKVATKLTLYSYTNKDAATNRTPYWKEVCGIEYTKEGLGADTLKCFKDLNNPDVKSYELDKVDTITFTNTGEQQCFVAVIEYEEAAADEPEVAVADSLKAGEVNVLEVGKTYILGQQYSQYQVSFTAPADGFLTITPSAKISNSSLRINGNSSTINQVYINGVKSGGVDKKGFEAGSVLTGKFYTSLNPADTLITITVSFEEGTPYTALEMTEVAPANGAEWSGASVYYTTYATYKGQPYYNFSSAINTQSIVASVTIGDKVYSPITVGTAKNGVVLKSLPDTLSLAVSEGLIKAGDTFTVTLSNIVDKEFSKNTLADQTFTYTLAATACTGVKSDASTSKLPTYVTFSFDGAVNIDNATFSYVNMFTGESTALTAELDEAKTNLTITGPTIEGLPSRQYKIVAENVTDADGKAISYSSDEKVYAKEEGKLIFTKALNNSLFNQRVSALSLDKWNDGFTEVYKMKSFSITWPAAVSLNEAVIKDIVLATETESSSDSDIEWWNEGETSGEEGTTEEENAEITVSAAVSETDPCTVIFTLSQEITELGCYSIEFPKELCRAKDYYTEGDDEKNNLYSYYSPAYQYAYFKVVERKAINVTDKLVNPDFETSATEGWTAGSTAPTGYGTSPGAVALKDGVLFSNNIVEKWTSTTWTGDIAQAVTNLPAGAYRFAFNVYVNNAGEAYVYANDGKSVSLEAGKVKEYSAYVELAEGAELKVGVNNVSGIGWVVMDNAQLYYYGEGSTVDMAYNIDWKTLLAEVEALKASYTAPIEVEALDAVVAAAKAGTLEEYLASEQAINDAMATFKAVNDEYVAWQALAATIDLSSATADAPVDATGFMTNPSFETGNTATGWTTSYTTNSNWANHKVVENIANPHDGKNGFETWSPQLTSVDLHQEVRLPAGSYVASAALRCEYQDQITNQHVYVKIGEDVNSSAALQPFTATWNSYEGWQVLSVAFTIEKEGKVIIGAASSSDGTDTSKGWFQIDNFKLACTGWIDPALEPAVDSLNTLIAEVEAYQKTLNTEDATQASMSESLTQAITSCKTVAEAKESVAAVREAYNSLYMNYLQIVTYLAGSEAQAAQELMATYTEPTDEAGLKAAIDKVFEIISTLSTSTGEETATYTIADLNTAVEAMRTAKEAFIVENPKTLFWDFAALLAQYENKTAMTYSEDVVKVGGIDCNVGTKEYAGLAAQGADKWILYTTGGLYNFNSGGRNIGVLDLTIGKIVTVVAAGEVLTLADETVAKQNSMTTADGLTTYVYEMTADGHLALTTNRNGTIVSIKVEEPTPARFDLTTYNDTVAWVQEFMTTLNMEDESEAEVYAACQETLQAAAEWIAELMEDPEATQEDVDYVAQDLKNNIQTYKSRIEISKLMVRVNEIRTVGDSIVMLYPEAIRTDEAGLIMALQSLPRAAFFVTSAEECQAAITAVENAIVPFQIENNSNLADAATETITASETLLAQYPDATDEAGLAAAVTATKEILAANDTTSTTYPVAEVVAAYDALTIAYNAFKDANVKKIAYLCGATETTEAIYTALVNAGYDVTPLNYDATTLTEEIVNNDFVGKYDVVVLAGGTGSGTELAKTANLLVGKVNVLSTKSFWYKHYGTDGDNPGSAEAPSLNLAKATGYEAHPIYSGIEGDEFAVFNDMAKANGRYLQSNGSFADETLAQTTIGTTLGADCIGEVWSNGFGYVIIPVDGAQPAGYLTADGEALFVNAVDYLIEGVPYKAEVVAIGNITVSYVQWPADIYDINGRMVKKNATSLEGLEKGLYLINGKKYMVK